MLKRIPFFFLGAASLLLAGCNSGGKSSTPPNESSSPADTSSAAGSSNLADISSTDSLPSSSEISSSSANHSFSSEWSDDDTYHWHACTDEGCAETKDKTEHTFGDVTYEWQDGFQVEIRTCSVCFYVQTKRHNHSYSSTYSHDEEYHWKECACGEQTAYGPHEWGDWVIDQEVSPTQHGKKHHTCSVCDYTYTLTTYYGVTSTEEGDFISFGSYPQSKVRDETILAALGMYDGTSDWVSYRYYAQNKQGDFMSYKDVVYDGVRYRGVYFSNYRPYWCYLPSSADNSLQDAQGYLINTTYWFKFEPIRWRILSIANDQAFLFSTISLDSRHFNVTSGKGDHDADYNWRAYDISDIRSWLNADFYATAFSDSERLRIKETVVDNSLESTVPNEHGNKYVCDNTNDNVFLLSRKEAMTYDYGFATSANTMSPSRVRTATDYARCQGTSIRAKESGSPLDEGSCFWWTRSPGTDSPLDAFSGDQYGRVFSAGALDATTYGVVPAINISI